MFKCPFCNFETDDEERMVYCSNCNTIACLKCVTFLDQQGFEEVICKKCQYREVK